ncbi:hypothetical protein FI667_g8036, partial [Globisporangium splendens]
MQQTAQRTSRWLHDWIHEAGRRRDWTPNKRLALWAEVWLAKGDTEAPAMHSKVAVPKALSETPAVVCFAAMETVAPDVMEKMKPFRLQPKCRIEVRSIRRSPDNTEVPKLQQKM